MQRRNIFGFASAVLAVCLSATLAHAEPSSESTSASSSEAASDDSAAPASDKDANAPDKSKPDTGSSSDKQEMVAEAQAGDSPVELPGKTYRFVGARYRGIIVPKFMENLFAAGGRTVYIHAFGPEFGIRKDGFEYSLSPWLALYNMDDTAFRGKSDPETAWELINAKMQILYLTSDFLWTHDFAPEFGLNYGLGAGLGIVFGDLHRVQSYPNGQTDPNKYSKCDAQGVPDPNYCDASNNHYGSYTEPSWANGGSKPIVFPWLTVQTGVRFKPSKSFAARLDLGFGTSGFFFGLGADYGL